MPFNDALFEMIVLAAMTSFFMSNPDRCCIIVSHGLFLTNTLIRQGLRSIIGRS